MYSKDNFCETKVSYTSVQSGVEAVIWTNDDNIDWDDRTAILIWLEHNREKIQQGKIKLFFIVNGPQPNLAAAAIREACEKITGVSPVIAIGKQYEAHLKKEDDVTSIVDGSSMTIYKPLYVKESNEKNITPYALAKNIDEMIEKGEIKSILHIVSGPVHAENEVYNPYRDNAPKSKNFIDNLANITQRAAFQITRNEEKEHSGYNYSSSADKKDNKQDKIIDDFIAMLEEHKFPLIFFDGAIAKHEEYRLSYDQKWEGIKQAGIQSMRTMNYAWLSIMFAAGEEIKSGDISMFAFSSAAALPFSANSTGHMFDIERFATEILKMEHANEIEDFIKDVRKIQEDSSKELYRELFVRKQLDGKEGVFRTDGIGLYNKFSKKVFDSYEDCLVKSYEDFCAYLNDNFILAINIYAEQKNITKDKVNGQSEDFKSLKEILDAAKKQKINIDSYNIMRDLFPILNDLTGGIAKRVREKADQCQEKINKLFDEKILHLDPRIPVYDAFLPVLLKMCDDEMSLMKFFREGNSSVYNVNNSRFINMPSNDHQDFFEYVNKYFRCAGIIVGDKEHSKNVALALTSTPSYSVQQVDQVEHIAGNAMQRIL